MDNGSSTGLSARAILLFIGLIATQIAAVSMLPKTDGFASLRWTGACLGTYALSFWIMSTIIREGQPLGLLVPLMSAVIPIATIIVGTLVYHEPASMLRIGLLVAACILVSVATVVS
ncbi:Multidrug transporter EmrE [Sphingobium faniae]|nr:Multidrug transporter EmrE [Sphingobium faniae]